MLWHLLFWLLFTGLFAYGQGMLMPALRKTPDGSIEADRESFALHWLFGAVWFAPVVLLPLFLPLDQVCIVALIALVVRFATFDPFLNYAAGDEIFSVGQKANTDRLQQWIAEYFGIPVWVISAILRGCSLLFLLWLLWAIY